MSAASAPARPSTARPSTTRTPAGVGPLLRDWRTRRRVSQMHLALDAGVSPRHLSCIETGRARPSPAVLLALAERLDVPLRERNRWLLAAGHAPRYGEAGLGDAALVQVRAALQRLLDAHDPYPGLVVDRHWNLVLGNRAAQALVAVLPPHLCRPVINVMRVSLHPEGMASRTANFADWAGTMLEMLARQVAQSGDPQLQALQDEVLAYPTVQALARAPARPPAESPTLLVPCVLDLPQGRVSMFTTLTTFGTPRDVTLQELSVELFYPADAASEALLRGRAPG
nr:helix-turn-helix transcriptional regulator [Ideonella sp. A 288]